MKLKRRAASCELIFRCAIRVTHSELAELAEAQGSRFEQGFLPDLKAESRAIYRDISKNVYQNLVTKSSPPSGGGLRKLLYIIY